MKFQARHYREPLERIRSTLLQIAQGGRKTLLLCPCGRGDVADQVTAALAVAFAADSRRVLLLTSSNGIDRLGCKVKDLGGFAELLERDVVPELASGVNLARRPEAADPGALERARLEPFLRGAAAAADLVLLAAPDASHPIVRAAAPLVDGVVFVISGKSTRRSDALAVTESVTRLGGRPVGFVFADDHQPVPGFIRRWFHFG